MVSKASRGHQKISKHAHKRPSRCTNRRDKKKKKQKTTTETHKCRCEQFRWDQHVREMPEKGLHFITTRYERIFAIDTKRTHAYISSYFKYIEINSQKCFDRTRTHGLCVQNVRKARE